jgi:hypothetical protein
METGQRCNATRSLRHSSCFTRSKLTLLEIMILTYDIMQNVPSKSVQKNYRLNKKQRVIGFISVGKSY